MEYKIKYITIIIILFIIWGSLAFFMIRYAEEIKEDPCSICARRMEGDVICSIKSGDSIIFYNSGGELESKTNLSDIYKGK